MSFLKLPGELLREKFFWYLGYNDVLRMRRVCKYTKKSADEHIRLEKRSPKSEMPILVDNDSDYSLSAFLQLDFPFTRIYILGNIKRQFNKWVKFFENEDMPTFLEKYGEIVTHLRISFMALPFWRPMEIQFYSAFQNLESLQCDHIDTRRYNEWMEKEGSVLVPQSFTRLKRLLLPNVETDRVKPGLEENLYPIWKFFDGVSSELEYFTHPKFSNAWQVDLYDEPCGAFTWVKNTIDKDPATGNLKIYDLIHFREEDIDHDTHSGHFMSLCESCANAGVKLKNVDPRLLAESDISDENAEAVDKTVISLKDGLYWRVFEYDLPLLESLEIKTRFCILPHMEELRSDPPNWPQLQKITLKIDTPDENNERKRKKEQFDKLEFVLFGLHRPSMKELCMEWDITQEDKAHLYKTPSPTSLTASMSNLTKLEIIGCLATNQFFVTLWNGLAQLKTVRITNCENLGDEGFIGENPSEPVFLKLQNLKDLQLRGLDKMPGITDALLYNVVRHIPLESLALYSTYKSDKSRLTLTGIEALNTSALAQSIMDLDVDLANFTEEEISKVVSQFRSSQMC